MTPAQGVILAFDFGLKRIGVATGNLLTRTASPLTTLTSHGSPPWREIDLILKDWQPSLIVVGDPGLDVSESLREALVSFNEALADRFQGPIKSVDESHSSTAAASDLREARSKGHYNRRLNKQQIDSHAACLIAEQWMSNALD